MAKVIEEHPLPARAMHWIHLLCMGGLAVSGWYIHRPFFEGGMGIMRWVHFICMYVVLINLVARIYWAFLGAARDWHEFALRPRDIRNTGKIIIYYLFVKREHPEVGKYNPPQKLIYGWLWPLLLIFQAISGFALYGPTTEYFSWFTMWVGGLAHVRLIHYMTMWAFIITVALHIYLSLAEDFKSFLYMFFGVRPEE